MNTKHVIKSGTVTLPVTLELSTRTVEVNIELDYNFDNGPTWNGADVEIHGVRWDGSLFSQEENDEIIYVFDDVRKDVAMEIRAMMPDPDGRADDYDLEDEK